MCTNYHVMSSQNISTNHNLNSYTDQEIVYLFNKEVGNNGWTQSRAQFLSNLMTEFKNRNWDFSIIGDEISISLKQRIRLNNHVVELE